MYAETSNVVCNRVMVQKFLTRVVKKLTPVHERIYEKDIWNKLYSQTKRISSWNGDKSPATPVLF